MTPLILIIIGASVLAGSMVLGILNMIMGMHKGAPIRTFVVHMLCMLGYELGSLTAVSGGLWWLYLICLPLL